MSVKHMSSKPEVNAVTFPALHTFLRGYFHEDVADECGTPLEAAEQFCEDAETDERVAVAKEWVQLMQLLQGRPLAEINQALTTKLGGSVRLNEEEVQQVSGVFARCLAIKQRHA
jgi:contact-dependent growth inhibition (CDI) system CdiI-like immunity protein